MGRRPLGIDLCTLFDTPRQALPSGRLQRLLADRKTTLDLAPSARAWLADKGYDPVYGARPLKRAIQKAVQDPLAELILPGEVRDGAHVPIAASRDGLRIVGHGAEPAEEGEGDGRVVSFPRGA